MRFRQGALLCLVFTLFLFGTAAAQDARDDSLPPEKTQMIYDTLLPMKTEIPAEPAGMEAAPQPGTAAGRMEDILTGKGIELRGESGQWWFFYDETQMFLLTDFANNRVRIMTPLARLDAFRQDADFNEIELLRQMMKANYLATHDVRLCMNKNIIWAAFLHPLDSLTDRDLVAALKQLADAARKTQDGTD